MGSRLNGLPYDRAGSDIDTTNPDAAKWYWNTIRDNILSKGFDSLWADETEPDLPPNGAYYKIGPGTQYYNVYPLLHVGAIYDGFRRDLPQKRGADSVARCVSGHSAQGRDCLVVGYLSHMGYVPTPDSNRARFYGFGRDVLVERHRGLAVSCRKSIIRRIRRCSIPSDARDNVGGYDDYPELYTRWFQYATFLPIMRTHGSRKSNEVWSYGKQAEPILEKYLRLRYELMPYIYSLGYHTWETGAPFMRALPLDFPDDPNVADLRDEYMFGPAFLVAPVTEQGATSRKVYLPAGADWYNYWTNERMKGGQTHRGGGADRDYSGVRSGGVDHSAWVRRWRARTRSSRLRRCGCIRVRMPTSRCSPTMARPMRTRKGPGR